jgi:hypothetical protein
VRRTLHVALALCGIFASSSRARADDDPNMPDLADLPITGVAAAPPPSRTRYLQYGPSLTAELIGVLSSPGPMCSEAKASNGTAENTCILGGGGGVAWRTGVRVPGPWYFGGAYALSKQDSNKIMRLPILQQLRGEARYYLRPDFQTQPFGSFGLGVAAYGNEGAFTDTLGPLAFAGVGGETQLSQRYVLVFGVSYKAMLFNKFTDSSGALRPSGLATSFGLEVGLESRDPL